MVDHFITANQHYVDGDVYLVTGSHGHIGSYIVEELCKTKDNIQIICVDSLYNGNIDNLKESLSIIEGKNISLVPALVDITNTKMMRETFEKYQPNYVFHCASYLTLDSNKHKSRSVNVNVYGSALVFELALEFGAKKVVYSSSASVYGTPKLTPTKEDYPFEDCKLLYGTTKIATEYIAKSFMEEGLDIVGLRYFNVYGPRQSLSNVYTQIVPKWIRSIVKGEEITIYGDGYQTMDMIFGADIGRANVAALENDECKNMFINVGTGFQTSVINLFELISDRMSKLIGKKEINVVYDSHDPNLVKRRCACCQKMHKYLGVHQVSIDQGIDITCRELYDRVRVDN
jgi:nucleoside-diphosphate-sugar epimerase